MVVWASTRPGDFVGIQEQEGQSDGERKRHTLEELDTAASRAKDEVERAIDLEEYESSETALAHGRTSTMGKLV